MENVMENVSLVCLSFERISCFLAKEITPISIKYDFVSFFEIVILNEDMSLKIHYHDSKDKFISEDFFDDEPYEDNKYPKTIEYLHPNQRVYLINTSLGSQDFLYFKIGQYINSFNKKINYFFTSDNKGCRTTMMNVITGIKSKNIIGNNVSKTVGNRNINYIEITIIILPCAHKIRYKNNGNCDGGWQFSSSEMSNCFLIYEKTRLTKRKDCDTLITYTFDKVIVQLNTDSSFYSAFYDGNRKTREGNQRRLRCRDTNFLKQIEYIQNVKNEEDFTNKLIKYKYQTLTGGKSQKIKSSKRRQTHKLSHRFT